jgi:hypothetical protein
VFSLSESHARAPKQAWIAAIRITLYSMYNVVSLERSLDISIKGPVRPITARYELQWWDSVQVLTSSSDEMFLSAAVTNGGIQKR